jgi:putative pyruvate formate lyase activating enzyme
MSNTLNGEGTLLDRLAECIFCPRQCRVNRLQGAEGYCRSGALSSIGSICLHHGEEPVISGQNGICNIFFTCCNIQCSYCQNRQISCNKNRIHDNLFTIEALAEEIISFLKKGCNKVGFVSPSHYVPQVISVIEEIRKRGYKPTFVYNTNSYDSIESIKKMEGLVDVYLPDFKYSDKELAMRLSDAPDYPAIAINAIREMYRQKGNVIHLDENGEATSGLIIRHLVLPGYINNSINALKMLAEELSTGITLSIMSQYNPEYNYGNDVIINRKLTLDEYNIIIKTFDKEGFSRGWIQDLSSSENYNPDFKKEHPFTDKS